MMRCLLALAATLAGTSAALAQLPPDKALASMTAGDGLQVELFAAEPMLLNPTAIDVDHKGRVWVAEAVNYRRKNFNRPILRPEGDRVVVLTDTNGDGKADESTVFYQGKELYGPLSVLVLPQADGKALRVLVAQSPDILEFWDKDGDLKADGPPTKFLTGFGGFDHDHGVHGLTVGPDGKLYFTVGDAGVTGLQAKDGKGPKFVSNATTIQKGTVWRCGLDGNNVELIAHNFRNNYEACVDSFGEIWLSDNDDDGNQQTRICFVMPGGNYGYGPRGPGQSHWHEEQPGVVHKTLRTGFGSPTGICFYEGTLLPKPYHGDLIHADAGPREIRYFKRTPKGAGYELEKINMLTSTDNWFRPSDVCVAPDGSVFVSDWYDPGVGGHGMGDWTRGRIYRLTPTGHKGYTTFDKLEFKKVTDLHFPCIASRVWATNNISAMKPEDALNALAGLHHQSFLPYTSARSWWLSNVVAKQFGLPGPKSYSMQPEFANRFEQMTERVNRMFYSGKMPTGQSSLAGQREVLLTIAQEPETVFIERGFYSLAKLYDGQDHFYRAALNIACGTDPERRDAILADFEKHFPEWNDKVADLVWELRPKSMLPKMERLLGDAKLTAAQKARIVDILAVNDDVTAGKTMLTLLKGDAPAEVKAKAVENLKLFLPTKWVGLKKSDDLRAAISEQLKGKAAIFGLGLAAAAPEACKFEDVQAVATDAARHPEVRREAVLTCGKIRDVRMTKFLVSLTADKDLGPAAVTAIGTQLGGQGIDAVGKAALDALEAIVTGDAPAALKAAALESLAGSRTGTGWLLKLKESGKFPDALAAAAGRLLRNSPFQGERNKAMILFPAPGKLDPKKLPPVAELAKRVGNAENGKAILARSATSEVQCLKCHMVRGQGGQIGPDLSMIGKKASKENLYDSLLTPSKAVADQYVSWSLTGEDGQGITGLVVGETETTVTVRDANGKDYSFPAKGTDRKKSLTSIMPEGLIATLTEDELVDMVEYLTKLQTPSLTPDSWQVVGPFDSPNGNAGLDQAYPVPLTNIDLGGRYDGKAGKVGWQTVRPGANGYVDLAALHKGAGANSVSFAYRVVESPEDVDATVLLGTDDGAKLYVNGEEAFASGETRAAAPGQNTAKVKLKRGKNELLLKIANGNNPHGFYLTIEGIPEAVKK